MNRRACLALALTSLLTAGLVRPAMADDGATLNQIATYLNGIHTLKARFTQVAPDGAISYGTAWLWRPGRMRFQYDPPSPLLLVAGDGKLTFRDNSLDQTSRMPINNSPLGILLADHIDLGPEGGLHVLALTRGMGEIAVTLARAGQEADGKLTLNFSTPPLTLTSWVVEDAQGKRTKVNLYGLDTGAPGFNPSLFVFHDPNLPPQ